MPLDEIEPALQDVPQAYVVQLAEDYCLLNTFASQHTDKHSILISRVTMMAVTVVANESRRILHWLSIFLLCSTGLFLMVRPFPAHNSDREVAEYRPITSVKMGKGFRQYYRTFPLDPTTCEATHIEE